MRIPALIVVLACLVIGDLPGAAHASPGGPRQKKQNKGKSGGRSGNPAARSVANVAVGLRTIFGGIAAHKLPQAMVECQAAQARVKEADAYLARLLREVEVEKQANRDTVAARAAEARREYIQVQKDYAEAMLQVNNRLGSNQLYRTATSSLELARKKYYSLAADNPNGKDTILALGKVSQLEAQIAEMEGEAIAAAPDAVKAKEAYEELKSQYKESQRDLFAAPQESGRRGEIMAAHQAVEQARRELAAKERAVRGYHSLIRSATFQKKVITAGG